MVAVARAIADDVLFPAALAVAGLYGAFVPPDLGGPGMEIGELAAAVEALAGGCLATTFVWIQHFGLLGSLLGDPTGALAQHWLGPAVRGEVTGGIALAG